MSTEQLELKLRHLKRALLDVAVDDLLSQAYQLPRHPGYLDVVKQARADVLTELKGHAPADLTTAVVSSGFMHEGAAR